MAITRRTIAFSTVEEKAQWLDANASLDSRLSSVRDFAASVARAHDPNDQEGVIRDLHSFVRDSIRYQRDPNREEQFADAATVLARGYDDCDGKARLFVALCRAGGLEARIRPVFDGHRDFVHVQAEARWPGSERHPKQQGGGWLLCELIERWANIGDDPDAIPRDGGGRRVLA